jgi:hypothetical protein
MGFKGTPFAIMENIKPNATAELRNIPKGSLPPVLPKVAGLMEQVHVRTRVLL